MYLSINQSHACSHVTLTPSQLHCWPGCLWLVRDGMIEGLHGFIIHYNYLSQQLIARNPRSSRNYFRKLSSCTATSNRMAGIERLTSFGVLGVPVC